MLVGVLTKSTTLLKMRLQMSESYATWQNLFELICDCVLKEFTTVPLKWTNRSLN